MDNMIFIPKEEDYRRWVREEINIALEKHFSIISQKENSDILISRTKAAEILDISLVTLNEWGKKGLPVHKNEGKVYYFLTEIFDFIKNKQIKNVMSKVKKIKGLMDDNSITNVISDP